MFDPAKDKPKTVDGWARFLTTGVPPFDMNPEVTAKKLKRMVDVAHLKHYTNPRIVFRMLLEISSFEELYALARGYLGMVSQIKWRHTVWVD